MFNTLKIDYTDGTRQSVDTELCGRSMAYELMRFVFYQDSTIACVRFFQQGKGKPLQIHRDAL